MDLIEQINSHKYLYLDRLYEEEDLVLCVIVDEAKVAGGLESFENATAYGPIVSDETCRRYKITFKNYVAYCVTNESCGGVGAGEQFIGNLFRTYSKSMFLEYLEHSTGGMIDALDPHTHYEVVTLNQIIDVAAIASPEIEIIPPSTSL